MIHYHDYHDHCNHRDHRFSKRIYITIIVIIKKNFITWSASGAGCAKNSICGKYYQFFVKPLSSLLCSQVLVKQRHPYFVFIQYPMSQDTPSTYPHLPNPFQFIVIADKNIFALWLIHALDVCYSNWAKNF